MTVDQHADNNTVDDSITVTPHGVTLRIASQLIGKLDAVSRQSATYIVAFFGGFLIVSAVIIRAGVFGTEAGLRIGSSGLLECLTIGGLLVVSGLLLSYTVFQANAKYAMVKLNNSFMLQKSVLEKAQKSADDADQVQADAARAAIGGDSSGNSQTTMNGGRNSDQATIQQELGK
jgi:hypothetical protein